MGANEEEARFSSRLEMLIDVAGDPSKVGFTLG
jgi:hypothetical protein